MILAREPFLDAAHLGGKRLLHAGGASLAMGDPADERTVNLQPAGHATVGAFQQLVTLKITILGVFAQSCRSEFGVIIAAWSCFRPAVQIRLRGPGSAPRGNPALS